MLDLDLVLEAVLGLVVKAVLDLVLEAVFDLVFEAAVDLMLDLVLEAVLDLALGHLAAIVIEALTTSCGFCKLLQHETLLEISTLVAGHSCESGGWLEENMSEIGCASGAHKQ